MGQRPAPGAEAQAGQLPSESHPLAELGLGVPGVALGEPERDLSDPQVGAAEDLQKDLEDVYGTSYADILRGSDCRHGLNGGPANDHLEGFDVQYDVLTGGSGGDVLLGGLGLDELVGGPGNDYLCGAAGPDAVFHGGPGVDLCPDSHVGC